MGSVPATLADAPETLGQAIRPSALANVIRGNVLLVAGVVTDSEDAISLGRQIAAGSSEATSSNGPRQPSPEEVAQMREELERFKRELSRARAEPLGSDAELLAGELERREAELREMEDRHRQLEEEVVNYPRPAYLGDAADGRVDIAVVGNSGVGKSLLINSLRGVQRGDPGWAPVGVNQTTEDPVAYAVPGQPGVRLWDLPGASSQQFPRGGYTRAIGLRHFELVLVVTTCRFTQTEAALLGELAASDVPSFVVRTMVDIDITSNQADHGQGPEETKCGIVEDLRGRGVPHVYLVNARQPGEHDFPRLIEDVLAAARKPRSQRQAEAQGAAPKAHRPAVQFEAGEAAELWSVKHKTWVKCVVEGPCEEPGKYDVVVPSAPAGSQRFPKIPAAALRKEHAFKAGEDAEIIVLQGPMAGSWIRCKVLAEGDKPDTYNVHIPAAPPDKRNLRSIPSAALRKAAESQRQQVQEPLLDVDSLKTILRTFEEISRSAEFRATIDSLQEMGLQREEVRNMKKTFITHQFTPVLAKHGLRASSGGWGALLALVKAQGDDHEVAKLAHEVERNIRVGIGDFFGIKPGQGGQVDAMRHFPQRLRDLAGGFVWQVVSQSRQAAQAQAARGAPTSRVQGAAADCVNPLSRSMVSMLRS